jgi:hypothetical protein
VLFKVGDLGAVSGSPEALGLTISQHLIQNIGKNVFKWVFIEHHFFF